MRHASAGGLIRPRPAWWRSPPGDVRPGRYAPAGDSYQRRGRSHPRGACRGGAWSGDSGERSRDAAADGAIRGESHRLPGVQRRGDPPLLRRRRRGPQVRHQGRRGGVGRSRREGRALPRRGSRGLRQGGPAPAPSGSPGHRPLRSRLGFAPADLSSPARQADTSMLRLDGVEAAYGLSRVLHGVTLEAREGEVVSLLGRNGAGKSTTLKAIVGLAEVRAGTVSLDGRDITALATHEISKLGIGWVPEDRRIFSDLTVEENLLVGAKGGSGWGASRVYEYFPKLAQLARRRGGSLSGGEQQMTVARTLMGNPR